jgi:BRCT domain type II-containing protein
MQDTAMQLQGKEIVLTGKVLGENRMDTSRRIMDAGGTTADKVTSLTSLVVVAGNPATCRQTTKFKAARKLGIPIIGDTLFGNLLRGAVTWDQAVRPAAQQAAAAAPATPAKPKGKHPAKVTKQINALVRESAKGVEKSPYAAAF